MPTGTQLDPTRTITLRRNYMMDMRRRFRKIRDQVTLVLVEQDVLGLIDDRPIILQLPEKQVWRFRTDAGKVEEFNKWFAGQVNENILTVDVHGNPWTAKYVNSAYKRGSFRAYSDARPEAMAESLDFYRGRREAFLESAFNRPERLSKLKFLYTRSYEDLKGISAAMSQQVSRSLADGIVQGLHPRAIARNISNSIDGITKKRALVMARTEVIAAHAEGQLDSFDELGVDKLLVMAEWSTAGDDRVCPLCASLDGVVMTVEEARGLIPRHANCRCSWIPANVGEREKQRRFWTKEQKMKQVNKSLKAELPKKTRAGEKVPQTVKSAKARSTWAGKETKFKKPPAEVEFDK